MKTASLILSPGAVLIAACLGAGGSTQAGTSTVQQTVKAQVSPSCTVTYGTAMAFGNLTATPALAVTQADATGTLTVFCPNGVGYSVVAGDGNNYGSGWRMVNGSGQYVTYQLYSDPARGTAFARTGNSLSYVANGGIQTLTGSGRVPAQTAGGVGNFTDSVSFTVTY